MHHQCRFVLQNFPSGVVLPGLEELDLHLVVALFDECLLQNDEWALFVWNGQRVQCNGVHNDLVDVADAALVKDERSAKAFSISLYKLLVPTLLHRVSLSSVMLMESEAHLNGLYCLAESSQHLQTSGTLLSLFAEDGYQLKTVLSYSTEAHEW
ncbi:hypothetical protein KIN20_017108 [Parelaphostrongylus tenuis]|uniref:Uncharacterized protein n=1 Tax=Parelaphostrongylus tenuis TaxID=148309 RepID=A0AAD5QTK7_PARTN|nr:hypothetical protein KIN20_017108 [Parelaphostrongylus tenuis]